MIGVKVEVSGNLGNFYRGLNRGLNDLRPVGKEIMRHMEEGNRKGLGTDKDGLPLAPLKFSTLLKRDGDGPPLAPHRLASRIVTGTVFRATGAGGNLAITMSWPSIPWLKYHRTGTRYMARRDIVGIRPQTMTLIRMELWNYWHDLVHVR